MKELKLGGKVLRCNDRISLGATFDLAESLDGGSELQQVAAMGKLLKLIVVKEDLPLLREVLYRDDEQQVTYDELNNAVGGLMVQYSNRPLGQPSSSSTGGERTGGSSKVVSLSRGTVKRPESSSGDGSSVAS